MQSECRQDRMDGLVGVAVVVWIIDDLLICNMNDSGCRIRSSCMKDCDCCCALGQQLSHHTEQSTILRVLPTPYHLHSTLPTHSIISPFPNLHHPFALPPIFPSLDPHPHSGLSLAARSYFPSKSLTLQIKGVGSKDILMLGAKTNLNSAYREFSRQRYNKYRHQYPSMREPDIILMIIRQWEALGTPKKRNISERLEAKGTAKEEDCFSTAQKTGEKSSRLQFSPTPYSKVHLPKATVYPPLFPIRKEEDDQDSEYHRNSQRGSEQHKSERSSYSVVVGGRDAAPKTAGHNYKYISFYKYYYAKLMHEHSRWSPAQIIQIIKLEWKKRQQQAKSKKIVKRVSVVERRQKQVSGKVYFGKSKLLDHKVRDRMWRRLPFESRMRYIRWSLGEDQWRRRNDQVVWKLRNSSLNDILAKK